MARDAAWPAARRAVLEKPAAGAVLGGRDGRFCPAECPAGYSAEKNFCNPLAKCKWMCYDDFGTYVLLPAFPCGIWLLPVVGTSPANLPFWGAACNGPCAAAFPRPRAGMRAGMVPFSPHRCAGFSFHLVVAFSKWVKLQKSDIPPLFSVRVRTRTALPREKRGPSTSGAAFHDTRPGRATSQPHKERRPCTP